MDETASTGLLSGLRILEIGHFVAAPFCTRLLADLGAEVIKIEPPGGDPVRQWGKQINGQSLWWSLHGRNKRSMTLNLKHPKAAAIVLRLVASCDALVENFHRAAFGVIGEAIGGLRYLSDHPPGTSALPPVRVGISIGDSVAGVFAAFGIMAAVWRRDRVGGDRHGRSLDVALTDSILSLMEGMLPEYSALGVIREPTGSRIPTAAPSNAYPTKDGKWILIAANSEPLFGRLARLMERPELIDDPRFKGNQARVAHVKELDA